MKHILKHVCFYWNESRHKADEKFFLLPSVLSSVEPLHPSRQKEITNPPRRFVPFSIFISFTPDDLRVQFFVVVLASGCERAQEKYVSRLGARHDDDTNISGGCCYCGCCLEVNEPSQRTIN